MSLPQTDSQSRNRVRSFLRGNQFDAGPGSVLDTLLALPTAQTFADIGMRINDQYRLLALRDIAAGTVVVDDQDFDQVAAYYGIERVEGVRANGSLRVVLLQELPTTVGQAQVFTADASGRAYRPEVTVSAVPFSAGGVESPSRQFIRPLGDGRFYVDVQAVARGDGPDTILISGDTLAADDGSANIDQAVAASTFRGGSGRETNAELAGRLIAAAAAPSLTGRLQLQRLADGIIPGASAALVNSTSPLARRNTANTFGVQAGGVADVYVRGGSPSVRSIVRTASVVDGPDRRATIVVDPDTAVGIYDISVVGRNNPQGVSGSIEVELRQLSIADYRGHQPQITQQTVRRSTNARWEVTFVDSRTVGGNPVEDWSGASIEDAYVAVIRLMPGVGQIADAVYGGDFSLPGLDTVVYAGTPLNLSLNVGVRLGEGAGLDQEAVRSAIAAAINRLPIGTPAINAFRLSDQVRAITADVEVVNVSASGFLNLPDGSLYSVSQSGSELRIPVDPANNVGPQTTFFSVARQDIGVSFV